MVKEMAQGISTGSIGELKATVQTGKDSLADVPVSEIVSRALAIQALRASIETDIEALQLKVYSLLEQREGLSGLSELLTNGYVAVETAQVHIERAADGSSQPSADKVRGALSNTVNRVGEAYEYTNTAISDIGRVAERLDAARMAVQNASGPIGHVAEIAQDLPSSLQTSQEAADNLAAFW